MQACQSLMFMSLETTFSTPLESFYNTEVKPLEDAVKGTAELPATDERPLLGALSCGRQSRTDHFCNFIYLFILFSCSYEWCAK